MTRLECFGPEMAAEILALAEGDPRRRHARDCPRCAALLDQYRLYMEMRDPAPGANPGAADARLSEFLAREIEGTRGAAPARSGRAEAGPPSWLERLLRPALRPAWAFAGLAIVLGGALLWPRLRPHPGVIVQRGGGPADLAVVIERADRGADGVRIQWRSFPGAERYEVRFYSADLQEIARGTTTPDTAIFLPVRSLPFESGSHATVLFRLYAQTGGEVLAASPARPLATR